MTAAGRPATAHPAKGRPAKASATTKTPAAKAKTPVAKANTPVTKSRATVANARSPVVGKAPARQASTGAAPRVRTARVELVEGAEHYARLVLGLVAHAKTSVWIATANVKEMRIEAPIGSVARARGRFVSVLETLGALAGRGVDVRLLHGAEPSRPFKAARAREEAKGRRGVAMRMCPRVHLKLVAVDGRALYLGSANFTGAGLGAKGDGRRNFEMGVILDDDVFLDVAQERFDRIWSGKECGPCKLRSLCPRPLDLPPRTG